MQPAFIKQSFLRMSRLWSLVISCAIFAVVATNCLASTITLQWDPETAPDLAGYKVYYSTSPDAPFTGIGATQGDSPVDVSAQTTATITGLDPGQPHYFAVTAYNAAGEESAYSEIVVVPELIPPTVSITSPATSAAASGSVSVSVGAADNVGVTKVELYVNGVLQGTESSAPYLFSWDTSALAGGAYALSAKAYDAAGNIGQSQVVSVTVVHDTTAPTVSLPAPATGATVSGTLQLAANAADNVGVTKVEYYLNGALLSAGNVPPYAYAWNTAAVANGSYALSAKAYDAAGNVGISASATVTVANTAAPAEAASTTATPATATAPATVTAPTASALTVLDAQRALFIASGKQAASGADMTRLDVAPYVNGMSYPNGKIDTGDVVVLLSKLVGKL